MEKGAVVLDGWSASLAQRGDALDAPPRRLTTRPTARITPAPTVPASSLSACAYSSSRGKPVIFAATRAARAGGNSASSASSQRSPRPTARSRERRPGGTSTISTNSPRIAIRIRVEPRRCVRERHRARSSRTSSSARARRSAPARRRARARRSRSVAAIAVRRFVEHERRRQRRIRCEQRAARLAPAAAGSRGTRSIRRRGPPRTSPRQRADGRESARRDGRPRATARTRRAPGSLIAGVPASLTSATLRPSASARRRTLDFARPRCARCSARGRVAIAVAPQQRRRHARVLGER